MPQTTSSFLWQPPPGSVVDGAPDADLYNSRYPGAAARSGRLRGSQEIIDGKFGCGGGTRDAPAADPPAAAGAVRDGWKGPFDLCAVALAGHLLLSLWIVLGAAGGCFHSVLIIAHNVDHNHRQLKVERRRSF